jgi:hypothetical protein
VQFLHLLLLTGNTPSLINKGFLPFNGTFYSSSEDDESESEEEEESDSEEESDESEEDPTDTYLTINKIE